MSFVPKTWEAAMNRISVRRVYAPGSDHEGRQVLVDRIWPRGLSKRDLEGVLWLREVGPSTELRKWFGHEPQRWPEFRSRYFGELERNPALGALRALADEGPVTLLYGAHDEAHNNAVALAEFLQPGGGRERNTGGPTSLESPHAEEGDGAMPRGDKSSYTDKQKRQAEHIEEGYEHRGVSHGEAERRAWATVNKETGGGKKSGSGRGRPADHAPSRKSGHIGGSSQSHVARSAAARKGWETRRHQAR
jgi:uncharacterized protein YeaO (DUF488 family)/plasmid stabilization system protein ParE